MKQILAWAFYDFAVTIFSMNVISRYGSLWVVERLRGTDWDYSVAFAVSMGLAAVSLPLIGTLADLTGRRLRYLRIATVVLVAATGVLGMIPALWMALICFGIANWASQVGGLCYDTLLPVVSGGRSIGLVSGIGVCCGYVGSLVGLMAVQPLMERGGYAAVFAPTAGLILLGALPCMCLVRDAAAPTPTEAGFVQMWWQRLADLRALFRSVRGLGLFLAGSFFCLNAINAVILFMGIFAKRGLGLDDRMITILLMASTVFALVGSLGWGRAADRIGPRSVLLMILCGWCLALALAVLWPQPRTAWLIGPLIGSCLGGTWSVARAMVVALTPPGYIGQAFGLFGFVGRAASNLGPLLWGAIVTYSQSIGQPGDRWGAAAALVLLVIGMAFLWRLPPRLGVATGGGHE